MRPVWLAVVLGLALFAGVGLAQTGQPQPLPATGVILGQVIDVRDNRPVGGAIVTAVGGQTAAVPTASGSASFVVPPGATLQTSNTPRRVMADTQGRFMFSGLTRGQYVVSATAPGYLTGMTGQTRPNSSNRPIVLKDDQKTGGVVVPMWRAGVLTGTVMDEAGEPAINVTVRTFRRTTSGLRTRFVQASSVRTDDRGIYRFANLVPGEYMVVVPSSTATMPASVVEAMQRANSARDNGASANAMRQQLNSSGAPSPNATGTRVGSAYVESRELAALGPVATQGDRLWVYQTTYFSSATTTAQATLVALSIGEERTNVDVQVRPVPTFRISGMVTGGDGPAANLGVRLLPANNDDFTSDTGLEVATTATEPDGSFSFLGVPPGAYIAKVLRVPQPRAVNVMASPNGGAPTTVAMRSSISVTEPTLWAEAPVAVGESDVAGVTLGLRGGPRVSGRIEFDGSAPRPPSDGTRPMANVNLSPIDPRGTSGPGPVTVSANGQFTSPSMPPGRYVITGSVPSGSAGPSTGGWMLRSAMAGGVDIADVPLDLQSMDVSGVVLTFFDRPAQLSGVVRNVRGEPDEGAMVFLIPSNFRTHLELGLTPRRLRSVRTGADGAYSIGGLLPGDYIIVAASENLPADGVDPLRFYETAGSIGTRLTVSPSEKKTQDLSISQVSIR